MKKNGPRTEPWEMSDNSFSLTERVIYFTTLVSVYGETDVK